MPYLTTENFGNPGSIHHLGRRAAAAVETAREQVADLIKCDPSQIIFTSGGSEANNLVFSGLVPYLASKNKTHIITSSVEHDSVLRAVNAVCNPLCHNEKKVIKSGFDATILPVNSNGEVDINVLQQELTEHTGLVSVMFVNNETGAVNPVREISSLCHRHNILFHSDCVQALSEQEVFVDEIGCDFISISAHKINAPKGIGALYVKDKSVLSPIIHGGMSQEFGLRGGTENVAGIVGFGKACERLKSSRQRELSVALDVKDFFIRNLKQKLLELGINNLLHINSFRTDSKILNLRFDGIDGQTLLLMLDAKDIYISAGSACTSKEDKPSHVLLSMGLAPDEARNSVRISFSAGNYIAHVIDAAHTMAQCVYYLHNLSMSQG